MSVLHGRVVLVDVVAVVRRLVFGAISTIGRRRRRPAAKLDVAQQFAQIVVELFAQLLHARRCRIVLERRPTVELLVASTSRTRTRRQLVGKLGCWEKIDLFFVLSSRRRRRVIVIVSLLLLGEHVH